MTIIKDHGHLLVVDNGSVYTKSLLNFLSEKKIDFTNTSFDKINLSELEKYSSIILSGRRKNDSTMNMINSKIIKHVVEKNKPLLGICYGAEILALTLGGTLAKLDELQYGIQSVDVTKQNPICEGKINVFESHSYIISKIDKNFIPIGRSNMCNFEIIQYKDSNIFGTQFHPEMSSDGNVLLEKFVTI